MRFLRRMLGGAAPDAEAPPPMDAEELEASEREHELEVLRAEQDRLDEFRQRQLRFAHYAWKPPAEGGERRADDEDASKGAEG